MIHNPLISIIVVTYNSQEYVIETLESIKKQTYSPIELIISDDCSRDNTVKVCEEWLLNNSDYFIDSKIITALGNSGIPANCNRGIAAAKGEWIKLIAGDDLLLPEALQKYMTFAEQNPDCEIIHCKVTRMVHRGNQIDYISAEKEVKTINQQMSPEEQFNLLKFSSTIKAPSVIIKKSTVKNLNYFDESIKLCEDWPFWLKVTSSGKKFFFLNDELVFYRIHDQSVYSSAENKFLISPFYKIEKNIYRKYIHGTISLAERIIFDYHYSLQEFFFRLNNNSAKNLLRKIYEVLNLPYKIYAKITFLKNYK